MKYFFLVVMSQLFMIGKWVLIRDVHFWSRVDTIRISINQQLNDALASCPCVTVYQHLSVILPILSPDAS